MKILLRPAAVALVLGLAAGCSKVPERAARFAVSEQALTDGVVPLAELPHRLCVRNAQYAYLSSLVEPLAPETRPLWPDWYATTGAGEGMTWQRQCDLADELGKELRVVLRALRLHAHALGGLATGRTVDTSGLEKLAAGAGTAVSLAGYTSSAKTVTDAGTGVASAAAKFIEWYRQGKLKEAISASDACIERVTGDLREVVDDTRLEIETVKRKRAVVLGMLRGHRWQSADSPAHILGQGFELDMNFDTELVREQASLDRYGATLERLAQAHHALAELARGNVSTKSADDALDALDAAIDDLLDQEWNR